jgi:membrane associated rhomboid family serine protease
LPGAHRRAYVQDGAGPRRSTMTSRPYQPQPFFSGPSFLSSAVGRLIVVTVAVYFIQILVPAVEAWLALTPRWVVERLFVWQLFTYMFLHGDFWHLFFNLIVLYFIGNMVESAWGSKRFLRYYVICGIGGALMHMLFDYDSSVLGASGAIFGLYLAAAVLFPDAYVYLYFVLPIKIKYLVMGLTVLQLAHGISGPSGVAYFAHLGGMAAGLWFFRDRVAQRRGGVPRSRRRGPAWRVGVRKRREKPATSGKIDSILEKISAKGYENLTPTEKRILENYSRQTREPEE